VLDIPVIVTGEKSAPFSVSKDLKLGDNEDIEPYLEKLRKIDLKSIEVTVSGLNAVQTINTMSLDASGVGTLFTQTNITSSNSTFTPQVDGAKLTKAGENLKTDRKLTLTISGTVSGPMAYNVHLVFTTNVVAGALD
jgi:hypothetical protein